MTCLLHLLETIDLRRTPSTPLGLSLFDRYFSVPTLVVPLHLYVTHKLYDLLNTNCGNSH